MESTEFSKRMRLGSRLSKNHTRLGYDFVALMGQEGFVFNKDYTMRVDDIYGWMVENIVSPECLEACARLSYEV